MNVDVETAKHLRQMTTRAFGVIEDPEIAARTAIDMVAIILGALPAENRAACGAILVGQALKRLGA